MGPGVLARFRVSRSRLVDGLELLNQIKSTKRCLLLPVPLRFSQESELREVEPLYWLHEGREIGNCGHLRLGFGFVW
jgi:hypothetical protein